MKLNSLFTDGAVLQRRKPVAVWGKTCPNSLVECTLGQAKTHAASGFDGRFLAFLPAQEAGGPYTLTVRCENESVTVNDVMIGEVWLASGQSNMEYPMHTWEAEYANSSSPLEERFLAEKNDPSQLRMFTVQRRATTSRESDSLNTGWEYATGENIPHFTAVGLFFARTLQKKLGVTVGIIHSSWGGTDITSWLSRSALLANPDCETVMHAYTQDLPECPNWKRFAENKNKKPEELYAPMTFSAFCQKDPGNDGEKAGWAEADFDDSSWKVFPVPGFWSGSVIPGNGIVWVRKEIELPASWGGQALIVHTGGIDKQDVSYFNGTEIGRAGKEFETDYWNKPRSYPVPGNLVRAGKNVIAIRNYSFMFDGGFNGEPGKYYLENPATGESIPLDGLWKIFPEHDFGGFAIRPAGLCGPGNSNSPSILFDGMIRPLLPYSIAGAIWYQGEHNTTSDDEVRSYRRKMADLIRDWRNHFEQGNFPFIIVQLANYQTPAYYEQDDRWAGLREAQRLSVQDVPNAGMAVCFDVGDAVNIHPMDKVTVGERLAAWALEHTYFVPGAVGEGPVIAGKAAEPGNRLRLFFRSTAGKLTMKPSENSGFYVSSDRRHYFLAAAEIEGNSVVLSAPQVENPVFARYAWAKNPICQPLVNGVGLPASPFEI